MTSSAPTPAGDAGEKFNNFNGTEDQEWDATILARIDGLALTAMEVGNADAYRHAQKAYHYIWTLMSDCFGLDYAEAVKAESR